MYHFVRLVITNVLIVHKRKFQTVEEAQEWNERTGICMNFILTPREDIDAWSGATVWVPLEK